MEPGPGHYKLAIVNPQEQRAPKVRCQRILSVRGGERAGSGWGAERDRQRFITNFMIVRTACFVVFTNPQITYPA